MTSTSNVKRFDSNLFNPDVLTKADIKDMVNNLIRTIRLRYPANNENANVAENLEKLGLTTPERDEAALKTFLGKSTYDDLIAALENITSEDLFRDKYLGKYSKSYREYASSTLEQLSKPTLVDLFCGSGGLSLGLIQSGFRVVFANDIEKAALQTYSFNHPEIEGRNITMGGIESIASNIDEYVSESVDVIAGGPPCQGFSEANRQRLIDDPRNKLYKYYVESVRHLKPKIFIMENVKGMLKVANQVVEDFNSSGAHYDISFKIFNAKDYGVPQNRERLIYVGIREDIAEKNNISADKVIKSIMSDASDEYTPLSAALYGLKPLEASRVKNNTKLENDKIGYLIDNSIPKENSYIEKINEEMKNDLVFNHKARYNNDRDIEIYGRMIPGDRSDSSRIADIMPYQSRNDIFKDKYFKLIPDRICKTITAHMKFDCNMYIHPSQARGLTPREAARVQSYPDDFFFQGSLTKTYQQIGNSVPPLLAREIGSRIIKYVY